MHRNPSPDALASCVINVFGGGEQRLYLSLQDARRAVQDGMLPANADKHADRAKLSVLAAVVPYMSLIAPCTELPAILSWLGSFTALSNALQCHAAVRSATVGRGGTCCMHPAVLLPAVLACLEWGASDHWGVMGHVRQSASH